MFRNEINTVFGLGEYLLNITEDTSTYCADYANLTIIYHTYRGQWEVGVSMGLPNGDFDTSDFGDTLTQALSRTKISICEVENDIYRIELAIQEANIALGTE